MYPYQFHLLKINKKHYISKYEYGCKTWSLFKKISMEGRGSKKKKRDYNLKKVKIINI